jgi:7-cyano-7-deazaguanine synthase
MSKAVVVLSGGLDSTVCMALARELHDELYAITFWYGQKHVTEAQAAGEVAGYYDAEHRFVQLDEKLFSGANSALTDDVEMPHMSYEELQESHGVSPTYVPFRNANLLSMATAYALTKDADEVWAGMHAEDAHNWAYPDCTPEFLGAMANAIYVGTYHKVRLVTPLMNMTKTEVVRLGLETQAPLELTMSCYEGTRPACGKCPTCVGRREAFASLGISDPIIGGYASG